MIVNNSARRPEWVYLSHALGLGIAQHCNKTRYARAKDKIRSSSEL